MIAFDLLCLGEPMLEFNFQGQDAAGRRTYIESHGGDASNVAIAAARQGARVAFASAVGDDLAGRSFQDLYRAEGVDVSALRIDPDNPTGVYFVSHDEGGHSFSYLRRGSAASRFRPADLPLGLIERSAILFASGISLAISETAADAVMDAIAHARATGRQVAIDTNYRPKLWPRQRAAALIEQAMRGADIALPGLEDAQALLGLTDPDAITDAYLGMGPKIVVLKMGAAGCVVATATERTRVPAFPCRPVDATGAGDTFCGSFLAELARGEAPVAAAEYAACAAALATTGFGAVQPMPRRAAVLEALGRAPATPQPSSGASDMPMPAQSFLDSLMRVGRVIPVVTIEDADKAVPLARALLAGGLRVIEVTLRTAAGLDAIARIAAEVPGMIIGAGTVLNGQQAEAAQDAGATFLVSPGLTPKLLSAVKDLPAPLLPGVASPSEAMVAMEHGLTRLKFFPAEPAGGVAMLKALHGPLRDLIFCPTGGIDLAKAAGYLACPNVACVGGSWLTPASAVSEGAWSVIEDLARDTVQKLEG